MITAVYARKSTDQSGVSDDQKSVTRQIEHARAYATRKGWAVSADHVYVDDGISGAEFANRAGFVRLMNALKPRPPFQVLVMSEESRLGREAIETAYALKQLLSAGVRVFFYLEDRERTLGSATDKILLSVTAFADELEREKARQRTYDAMVRKARAGHVTGGRVFGYDNVEIRDASGRRSHVERRINQAEAAVIGRMFELSASGHGHKRIARALNEDAVPAPRAQLGRPVAWCPASVQEALKRELYRGVIVWNRSRKRDAWGKQKQQPKAEEEWLRVDAPQLRIVSEELWNTVHERLAGRRATYLASNGGQAHGRPIAGTVSKYLLTSLASCGCCEGTMCVKTRAHGRRRVPRLACWHYHSRGTRACGNRSEVPLEPLEELVLSAIEEDLLAPAIVDAAVDRAVDLMLADAEPQAQDREQARQALGDVQTRIANLTAIAAAGAGDVAAVVNGLRELEARRRSLASLVSRTPRQRQQGSSRAALAAQLRRHLDDYRGLLRANVIEARPVLTTLLAGRIIVTPREAGQFHVRIPLTMRGMFEGMCGSEAVQEVWRPQGVAALLGPPFARLDAVRLLDVAA